MSKYSHLLTPACPSELALARRPATYWPAPHLNPFWRDRCSCKGATGVACCAPPHAPPSLLGRAVPSHRRTQGCRVPGVLSLYVKCIGHCRLTGLLLSGRGTSEQCSTVSCLKIVFCLRIKISFQVRLVRSWSSAAASGKLLRSSCPGAHIHHVANLLYVAFMTQADAMAASEWAVLRAVGSAASCGFNAVPAALEALLVADAGFPGEVL